MKQQRGAEWTGRSQGLHLPPIIGSFDKVPEVLGEGVGPGFFNLSVTVDTLLVSGVQRGD